MPRTAYVAAARPRRDWIAVALVALAGYVFALAAPSPAHAASGAGAVASGPPAAGAPSGGTDAAGNLGTLLHNWGAQLLLGVAGILGVAIVAQRDIRRAVELGLLVLLIGGLVFAPDTIKGIVYGFWQSL